MKKIIFILTIFLSFAGFAEIKKITICQTTDIHGFFRKSWKENPEAWLSAATIIKAERKKAKENFLLIDCGDTLQGSFITLQDQGETAINILNDLKYDVWVPGNHDFDFGFKTLKLRTSQFKGDTIISNIETKNNPFLSWKMFDIDNVKIAIIGITAPNLDDYNWGSKLDGFQLSTIDDAISKIIPDIMKAKANIIILASHFGLYGIDKKQANSLYYIAKKYPQIELILGGHIHTANKGELIGQSTWFAQSEHHAESVLKIDIFIDTEKNLPNKITGELLSVKGVKEDKLLVNKYNVFLEKSEKLKSKKIGYLEQEKDAIIIKGKSSISEFIALSAMKKLGINTVIIGSVSSFAKLQGDITELNLYLASPYQDTIATLDLNIKDLKAIIKEQEKQKKKNLFQTLYHFSDKMYINKKAIAILANKKKIKVAFSSFVLAGARGKFPVLKKLSKLKRTNPADTNITIRDIMRTSFKLK